MKLFDVYPLFDINIVKGKGCHVWDDQGTEYLDLYGGHAVISIGHAHPYYVEMISKQVAQLGFYSNSVVNKLQQEVADRLGKLSGYDDYQLFLINSGAEANENALKLASFYNGRNRVLSFCKAFHGRTSLAVEVTHNPKIIAPINDNGHVTYLPLNDIAAAQARWLPPKVVPNCPYTGLNFGLIRTPAIGKPLPIPFATVIISGRIPACW